MISEAIIVAGGKGTRLQGVIDDIPKPMAPIGEKPFLEVLFNQLIKAGIQRVVLSVGYKWESIKAHFGENYKSLSLEYAVEKEPLGTGGGIMNAAKHIESYAFYVINGDTFFDVNFRQLYSFYLHTGADICVALKPLEKFDRYGSVELNDTYRIVRFKEKQFVEKGYINGGIYIINQDVFSGIETKSFSFEKDILEKKTDILKIYGFPSNGYFIDIGIPEDYRKAINELSE